MQGTNTMDDEIKKQEVLDQLHESGRQFKKAMQEYQDSCNSYWNSLNPEEQLMAFCAMVERIHRGELENKRSYRGILYGVFGWGPEAYAPAQLAGFLDLHNSIYTFDDLLVVVKNTLEELEISVDDERLADALAKHFY
jgi:hypothetical protein